MRGSSLGGSTSSIRLGVVWVHLEHFAAQSSQRERAADVNKFCGRAPELSTRPSDDMADADDLPIHHERRRWDRFFFGWIFDGIAFDCHHLSYVSIHTDADTDADTDTDADAIATISAFFTVWIDC